MLQARRVHAHRADHRVLAEFHPVDVNHKQFQQNTLFASARGYRSKREMTTRAQYICTKLELGAKGFLFTLVLTGQLWEIILVRANTLH